ncbi:hypothetical protein GCM10027565_03860 [Bordetella tumulicola]
MSAPRHDSINSANNTAHIISRGKEDRIPTGCRAGEKTALINEESGEKIRAWKACKRQK